ncbi:MAG: pirin family protein, partial [Candidatus Omnitrophica bacterium]|nr:pirin family protein [Candidatus Omnitrophota bacterium]
MFKETQHGRSEQGWLKSWFHFSFAEYDNPRRMRFGALRVINDDLIEAGTGFDAHPHRDMEIVSYVVAGGLTHTDSMGNRRTLTRGQIQYMSAGTGVTHSEHNTGKETTRILQIWILPDKKGHTPRYGDYPFEWGLRENRWLRLVSPEEGDAPVKIHQDANIDVVSLEKGRSIGFDVRKGRQAYLVLIEGSADINGNVLRTRDGLE